MPGLPSVFQSSSAHEAYGAGLYSGARASKEIVIQNSWPHAALGPELGAL
jgi:hypothetical protein